MGVSWPALAAYVAAWVGTAAAIYGLFDRAETVLSPESRDQVRAWLRRSGPTNAPTARQHFVRLFDGVFGKQHLSFSCLRRSTVATLIAATLLVAVWYAFNFTDLSTFVHIKYAQKAGGVAGGAAAILGIFYLQILITNVIPDYLSLLETRWLLGRVQRQERFSHWRLLLGDALLSSVLSAIGILAYLAVLAANGQLEYLHITSSNPDPAWSVSSRSDVPGVLYYHPPILRLIVGVPLFQTRFDALPLGIGYWTGFVASMWFWLYLLAGPVGRVLPRLQATWQWTLKILDVDKQPVRSIGWIASVIVSILFILALPWVLV